MKKGKLFIFLALASLFLLSTSFDCLFTEEEEDPTCGFWIKPETGTIDTEFEFNAFASYDDDPFFAWTIYDENQNKIDLGDDRNEYHFRRKFDDPGLYKVKLFFSDNIGQCDDEKTFRVVEDVGEFPVAIIQVSTLEGTTTTIFEFDASQSHDGQTPSEDLLVRWDWNGDGEWDTYYSTDKKIEHIFNDPGEYEVSLQVKDADANESDIAKETIKVNYATGDPEASFTIDPDYGSTITDFKFDASDSWDVITPVEDLLFSWDFENDGVWEFELSDKMIVEHRYLEEGEFEVKLMVHDADELFDYKIKALEVINCINGGEPCAETPTVVYEGKIYNTVQIGTQCWLKENLNIGDRINDSIDQANNQKIEKYCYDNLEANCEIYGGLYQWDEMMKYSEVPGTQGICPDDWRIPTEADWDDLAATLVEMVGQQMKSCTDDWLTSVYIINSNESGFTGLPAGRSTYWHTFESITEGTNFWTSNFVVWGGRQRMLSASGNDLEGTGAQQWTNRKNGLSVRCMKIP